MKLVYTQANRLLVNNAHNILVDEGYNVVLKNEFAGGAAGDLSPFDTWLELWVADEDFARARNLLQSRLTDSNLPDWTCPNCRETNSASFELCWNCGQIPAVDQD